MTVSALQLKAVEMAKAAISDSLFIPLPSIQRPSVSLRFRLAMKNPKATRPPDRLEKSRSEPIRTSPVFRLSSLPICGVSWFPVPELGWSLGSLGFISFSNTLFDALLSPLRMTTAAEAMAGYYDTAAEVFLRVISTG